MELEITSKRDDMEKARISLLAKARAAGYSQLTEISKERLDNGTYKYTAKIS